jgi:hypothetical protein
VAKNNKEIQNLNSEKSKASRVKRWFEYADLHNADLGQWRVAPERNKIATAADWLTSTKWKGHLNSPKDFERLKVKAKQLADAVDQSAVEPSLSFMKANEVAAAIIVIANDLDP